MAYSRLLKILNATSTSIYATSTTNHRPSYQNNQNNANRPLRVMRLNKEFNELTEWLPELVLEEFKNGLGR